MNKKIANELRIGNIVYESSMDNPIPLTPEIIEKCGFKKSDDVFIINNFWALTNFEDKFSFGFVDADNRFTSLCYVQYLHKLQNIYFSLTDAELKYE